MCKTSGNTRSRAVLRNQRDASNPSPDVRLQFLIDGIAESVLEASDEELLEELHEEGRNPAEEAEAIRRVLLDAVDLYQRSANDRIIHPQRSFSGRKGSVLKPLPKRPKA